MRAPLGRAGQLDRLFEMFYEAALTLAEELGLRSLAKLCRGHLRPGA